jgi:hypothetical protein
MNLADIDVSAVLVYLRVVLVKDGGVGTKVRRDLVAGIARSNDIGCLAVLARDPPKANGGSWH